MQRIILVFFMIIISAAIPFSIHHISKKAENDSQMKEKTEDEIILENFNNLTPPVVLFTKRKVDRTCYVSVKDGNNIIIPLKSGHKLTTDIYCNYDAGDVLIDVR